MTAYTYQPTFTCTVQDNLTGFAEEVTLPYLACGREPFDHFGELLAAMTASAPKPEELFSPEHLAAVKTRFTVDRLSGGDFHITGSPRWRKIYAEQVARALWESVRTWQNMAVRCNRHAWNSSAPEHMQHGFAEYFSAALADTIQYDKGHCQAAIKAWGALKAGQPMLTDGQLTVQVLNELDSILNETAHPEYVPGAKPMY